ncbi:hypothetical protein GCM10022198_08820 [Klugiella xanthotipulae]
MGRCVHAKRACTDPGDAPLGLGERAELDRLRREVQELRMYNEFLGKLRPSSR